MEHNKLHSNNHHSSHGIVHHGKPQTSGIPWLDQPVRFHSLRKSSCNLPMNLCKYKTNPWRFWYVADHVYAYGVVYFMCICLGLLILIKTLAYAGITKRRELKLPIAFTRYLVYKPIHCRLFNISLASLILSLIGILFVTCMTFIPQPYYWPKIPNISFGNSPPLATRTGWMALALLPFLLAFSTKANLLTYLSGVSHEHLQLWHQLLSYIMFVLSLIHTFPFPIFRIAKGDMRKTFRTSVVWWTGIVSLLSLAYLTIMSFRPIRNRFYEFFKATHIAVAFVFVFFLFIHCDFRLSSWDFFVASGVLYFSSIIYSQFRTFIVNGVSNHALLEYLPCGMVKVSVTLDNNRVIRNSLDRNFSWRPGQHIFLRFCNLGLHSWTSHPFTITSLPEKPTGKIPNEENKSNTSTSKIIVHITPRDGTTARLAALARNKPNRSIRVFIDGPYGGVLPTKVARYNKILVIAGGSGGAFALPIIESILRLRMRQLEMGTTSLNKEVHPKVLTSFLNVVFVTPANSVRTWFLNELVEMGSSMNMAARNFLRAKLYSTNRRIEYSSVNSSDEALDEFPERWNQVLTRNNTDKINGLDERIREEERYVEYDGWNIEQITGRPDVPRILDQMMTVNNIVESNGDEGMGKLDLPRLSLAGKGKSEVWSSLGVVVCGPDSLVLDVSNSVARLECDIVRGKRQGEVFLHREEFSW